MKAPGAEGQSSIRKVELKTGRVVQRQDMDNRFLGEGLTEWRGQLIQLAQPRPKPDVLSSQRLPIFRLRFFRPPVL